MKDLEEIIPELRSNSIARSADDTHIAILKQQATSVDSKLSRLFETLSEHSQLILITERDVSRFDVVQINSVALKDREGRSNDRPAIFELLDLLLFPFLQLLGIKRRLFVEIRSSEIENERRRDDGHFNDEELVIPTD